MTEPREPPQSLPPDALASFNPDKTVFFVPSPEVLTSAGGTPVGTGVKKNAQTGDLELRHVIGRGGFGEVWEAVQVSLGRVVAAKRMRDDLHRRDDLDSARAVALQEAFRAEALTSASLEHPNIVPIYDLGIDGDGRTILAMKYVRGKPWSLALQEEFNAMPVPEFLARHLAILISVSQAVAYAHSRGIVHRDLKPSQVMVGEFGEVLLMDWGLAVAYDPEALAARLQNQHGEMVPNCGTATSPAGTPAFMAPEQTEPTATHIGPWTDIYLLGGTLYYILTGDTPHTSDNSVAAFYEASEGVVVRPESKCPDREIPADLSELCMFAMAAKTTERPGSAGVFITALQDHLSGTTSRREAMALADQVRTRIENAGGRYAELADADNLLTRAMTLWPGMPGGAALRERVLGDYVRSALDHGDLMLARVQAERFNAGEERTAFLDEISRRNEQEAGREVQRRRLILVAAVLPFLLLMFGVVYYSKQTETQLERARAEAAQALANSAEIARAEQAERAVLFQRVNDLRRREIALASELGRVLPLPNAISQFDVPSLGQGAAPAQIEALLAQRNKLREERQAIMARAAGALEPESPELLLADANMRLRTATDTEDYLQSYALYERASKIIPDRPEPFTGMGVAAYHAGSGTSTTMHLQHAAELAATLFGPESVKYSDALDMQARAIRTGDFVRDETADVAKRAVSLLEPHWIELSINLSKRQRLIGNLQTSAEMTSPALKLALEREPRDERLIADARVAYGSVILELGDYMEARKQFEGVLQYIDESGSYAPLSQISILSSLGDSYRMSGQIRESVPFYERAREISEKTEGVPPHMRALVLNSLSGVASIEGRLDDAIALSHETLRLVEQSLDRDNPVRARALANLGSLYSRVKKFEEAEKYLLEALEITNMNVDPKNPTRATLLNNLGALRYGQDRLAEAEPMFRDGLAALEAILGSEHPTVATAVCNLSHLNRQLGHFDDAIAMAERSLAIREATPLSRAPGHRAISERVGSRLRGGKGRAAFDSAVCACRADPGGPARRRPSADANHTDESG
jgi:serine/threonine protein kinase/tetratricopeptide (TPR) repeat protein